MSSQRARCARMCAVAWMAMVGGLLPLAAPVAGDELATQGRQVVERWKEAVVTVRLVLKTSISFGGEAQEEEEKTDATGTVIDPSGLTVVSLYDTDPAEVYKRMMGGEGMDQSKFSVESKVTDLKLRFADGKEVPAKVVLRDNDLDLAFVRPQEKLADPVPALDLSDAAAPDLLDQIVWLDRLREEGDWGIITGLDRIATILHKPRTMYIPWNGDFVAELGAPAFSLEGKLVGILVMRLRPSAGAREEGGMLAVMLPAADILEVAKQALAAQ